MIFQIPIKVTGFPKIRISNPYFQLSFGLLGRMKTTKYEWRAEDNQAGITIFLTDQFLVLAPTPTPIIKVDGTCQSGKFVKQKSIISIYGGIAIMVAS